MRVLVGIVKWVLALSLAAIVGVAAWLYVAPPALIRVGTGYAAKIVCSSHFVAGRDADDVLRVDVQAPGHPLLRLVGVSVDETNKTVSATMLSLFGTSRAVWRDELGCASIPDGDMEGVAAARLSSAPGAAMPEELWPSGMRVAPSQRPDIQAILDDVGVTGPGMRAVVVVQDGRIVAERYGSGFSAETPLLGWSMTKTVNAAIIGTLVRDGRLALDKSGLFAEWRADDRNAITVADLMAMSSGLTFNEDYGDVTDVTRMLYLERDMAAFAASKPLAFPIGSTFSYSSGTAVLLSRIWQDAIGDPDMALAYPRDAIFQPLGMRSAVLETDAHGTLAGSSYLYATARDWARFAQFLLQEGKWDGEQILPAGFVTWMRQTAPSSNGQYGRGQLWQAGPGGTDIDAAAGIPEDAYWLRGHDGQTIAIVPSRNTIVLRMGLTPSRLGWRPQRLVGSVLEALLAD